MEQSIQQQFPAAINLLKEEFSDRKSHNQAYSLRGFARDLDLSPSLVSQIFNRKKNLSEATAFKIVDRVNWEESHKDLFLELVRLNLCKSDRQKQEILQRLAPRIHINNDVAVLDIDMFKLIYKWYHQAIVELSRDASFELTPSSVANRINISEIEAEVAIERLQRLSFLVNSGGKWVPSSEHFLIQDIPSRFIRDFHRQMLLKAEVALVEQSISEREFSGNVMMIDPERLPEAKNKIKAFRKSLMNFLEGGKKQKLYHLSLQLFSLED